MSWVYLWAIGIPWGMVASSDLRIISLKTLEAGMAGTFIHWSIPHCLRVAPESLLSFEQALSLEGTRESPHIERKRERSHTWYGKLSEVYGCQKLSPTAGNPDGQRRGVGWVLIMLLHRVTVLMLKGFKQWRDTSRIVIWQVYSGYCEGNRLKLIKIGDNDHSNPNK